MATGRTVSKWVTFLIDDETPAFRTISINSVNVCGLTYEEHDLTAFQDAVKGALPGMPDAPVEVGGPWTTGADENHDVLSAVVGLSTTLSLAVGFGMRAAFAMGTDVAFGITSTAGANGYFCTSYTIDPSTMLYSARFVVAPGSALPTFTTAAIT